MIKRVENAGRNTSGIPLHPSNPFPRQLITYGRTGNEVRTGEPLPTHPGQFRRLAYAKQPGGGQHNPEKTAQLKQITDILFAMGISETQVAKILLENEIAVAKANDENFTEIAAALVQGYTPNQRTPHKRRLVNNTPNYEDTSSSTPEEPWYKKYYPGDD